MAENNFSKTTLPTVVAFGVSGRVVALGKGVKDFKVDEEVFGFLNFDSSNGGGALQQYSVGEANALIKKPASVTRTDAAALGVAFLSALDGLRQVKIDSSTFVFVPGGSGGVGHFMVQIAQIRGAKQVITSASKEDGIRILKDQYGIKDVINHAKENVVERVLELTGGEGVDVVYDSTYLESSFEKSIKTVKEGGCWILLRSSFRDIDKEMQMVTEQKAKIISADVRRYWMSSGQAQLRPFIRDGLAQGAKWIEEGKLKP